MPQNDFELIDFHAHILPGIDDGSKSMEMSLEMLDMLKCQGVYTVVASPHFHLHNQGIEKFCDKRDEALYKLERHIKETDLDLPEIVAGSEVALCPGLHKEELLGRLCIDSSKTILVEMPYEKWTDWMYNEVYALCARGYLPVIAHVERYLKTCASGDEILENLLRMQVLAQCNAESFAELGKRRLIKKIFLQGKLAAIGSDSHDTSLRKPNLDIACKYITKKLGPGSLEAITKKTKKLFGSEAFNLI